MKLFKILKNIADKVANLVSRAPGWDTKANAGMGSIIRPNDLTSATTAQLEIYAVGKWK